MSSQTKETFLTTKEVSERFKVSEKTVERWRTKGLVSSYRIGARVIRFKESEINQALKSLSHG